jgi:hypothetical protein
MSLWSRCIATILLLSSLAAQATSRTVVTFEDISPNDLADGYGRLAGWAGLGGPGIADRDVGGNGLKVFYGHRGTLSFLDAPVRFLGTFYRSYVPDLNEPPFAALELWYQGQPVASIIDPQSATGLTWLSSTYTGPVDAVRINGGIEGFAIDDFSYERLDVSPVPEPGSAWLLAGGLAAIARRRFRRGRAEELNVAGRRPA